MRHTTARTCCRECCSEPFPACLTAWDSAGWITTSSLGPRCWGTSIRAMPWFMLFKIYPTRGRRTIIIDGHSTNSFGDSTCSAMVRLSIIVGSNLVIWCWFFFKKSLLYGKNFRKLSLSLRTLRLPWKAPRRTPMSQAPCGEPGPPRLSGLSTWIPLSLSEYFRQRLMLAMLRQPTTKPMLMFLSVAR